MSIFGRIAAGAGRAGVELANKYIDEELLQQRQQFMSDLRLKETKALDEYQMSEGRVSRQREIKAGDAEAAYKTDRDLKIRSNNDLELQNSQTEAARRAALAAGQTQAEVEKQRLRDKDLQVMQREKAVADARTATQAKMDEAIAMASNPEYLKSARKLEALDPKNAAYVATQSAQQALLMAQKRGVELSNQDKEAVQQLQKDMADVLSDPNLSDEERAKKMRPINARLVAYGSKDPSKAADGEKYETTRETVDKDGNKTIEKVSGTRAPRDPNASPYPEGSMLTGPDGKRYVVRGGKPVLADQAPAAKATSAAPARSIADVAMADTRPPADEFQQRGLEALRPVAAELKDAKVRLAAASKSGDPTSIKRYADEVTALQRELESGANKTFGNSADRFLRELMQ